MTHRGVFFEILATDQNRLLAFYEAVFGWSPDHASSGFAYVTMPAPVAVRGGIGKADPGEAGWEPGAYFYIMVEDAEAMKTALARVQETGGEIVLKPSSADGYTFAMFKDPEGNSIGLVLPFPDSDHH